MILRWMATTWVTLEPCAHHGRTPPCCDALIAAARRGVQTHVLIDGWGSPDIALPFTQSMLDAGVHLRSFEPARRLFGARINMLGRMHHKLVVIDARRAFVGGINYAQDHLVELVGDVGA